MLGWVHGQQGSVGTCPLSLWLPGGLLSKASVWDAWLQAWITDPTTIEAVKGYVFMPWVGQHFLCCEVSVKVKEPHSRRASVDEP